MVANTSPISGLRDILPGMFRNKAGAGNSSLVAEAQREAQRRELGGRGSKQSPLGAIMGQVPGFGKDRDKIVQPDAPLNEQFVQSVEFVAANPLMTPFQTLGKWFDRRGQVLDPNPNPFS